MIQIKKASEMTEDEIFAEVSDLLAMGVRRLKSRVGYLDAMEGGDEDESHVHDDAQREAELTGFQGGNRPPWRCFRASG